VRDAKQQETELEYHGDHNVTGLTEANTAEWTWTYDPKTGFPLTITDAQAVADGTPGTTLTCQTSRNGCDVAGDLLSVAQDRQATLGHPEQPLLGHKVSSGRRRRRSWARVGGR
jgi:YD repeat-containing protein